LALAWPIRRSRLGVFRGAKRRAAGIAARLSPGGKQSAQRRRREDWDSDARRPFAVVRLEQVMTALQAIAVIRPTLAAFRS